MRPSGVGVRLMVVSEPCRTDVNRAVYRRLATSHDVALHLVVPIRKGAILDPLGNEPFPSTVMPLEGRHPRTERAKALKSLIRDRRPAHVLVDAEVASALVYDAATAAAAYGGSVSVLSTENRTRHFVREGLRALAAGRPDLAAGGVLAWWMLHAVNRRIAHVLTISNDGQAAMAHLGFSGRTVKMPLGFDPALFYRRSRDEVAALRRRMGLTQPTFAYFGRLMPGKGVHLLLEALAAMRDVPWQFMIDRFSEYASPYQQQLDRDIDRLRLRDRIVTFDATHREIPEYMNAADIVVLPSVTSSTFKEQYGRVIPEAMACGKLVVASTCGAFPELVGDAGFIFPEGNVAALTGMLRSALALPPDEADRLRRRAEQRAMTGFSVIQQAEILHRHVLA